jgi:predicted RND superfamily exporter protein
VRTVIGLTFVVGSSVLVASRFTAAFVLVWLLTFYVAFGVVESLVALPRRLRERRENQRSSTPS